MKNQIGWLFCQTSRKNNLFTLLIDGYTKKGAILTTHI